jgi:hypothetical protein
MWIPEIARTVFLRREQLTHGLTLFPAASILVVPVAFHPAHAQTHRRSEIMR